MPFNGSGVYTAPSSPGAFNPAVTGSSATPAAWNTLLDDIETALSTCITKNGQTTVTANIPMATFRITGLGNPVDQQDAATKASVISLNRSYLAGLGLSRSSTTVLAVAAGFCIDSTNVFGITLAAFTKSTAGAWAAGSGSNGMGDSLTIGNNTWYHVFAIINGGSADVYFDTSAAAANAPASTTAFRRIGSFLTNGSAQIIDFVQYGDKFLWLSPVLDVNASSTGTSAVTRTLTVPTGFVSEPILSVTLDSSSASFGEGVYLSALSQTDTAPDGTNVQVAFGASSATGQLAGMVYGVFTNTSAQIRSRCSTGGAATALRIKTHGWIDRRGRDD